MVNFSNGRYAQNYKKIESKNYKRSAPCGQKSDKSEQIFQIFC